MFSLSDFQGLSRIRSSSRTFSPELLQLFFINLKSHIFFIMKSDKEFLLKLHLTKL